MGIQGSEKSPTATQSIHCKGLQLTYVSSQLVYNSMNGLYFYIFTLSLSFTQRTCRYTWFIPLHLGPVSQNFHHFLYSQHEMHAFITPLTRINLKHTQAIPSCTGFQTLTSTSWCKRNLHFLISHSLSTFTFAEKFMLKSDLRQTDHVCTLFQRRKEAEVCVDFLQKKWKPRFCSSRKKIPDSTKENKQCSLSPKLNNKQVANQHNHQLEQDLIVIFVLNSFNIYLCITK